MPLRVTESPICEIRGKSVTDYLCLRTTWGAAAAYLRGLRLGAALALTLVLVLTLALTSVRLI